MRVVKSAGILCISSTLTQPYIAIGQSAVCLTPQECRTIARELQRLACIFSEGKPKPKPYLYRAYKGGQPTQITKPTAALAWATLRAAYGGAQTSNEVLKTLGCSVRRESQND